MAQGLGQGVHSPRRLQLFNGKLHLYGGLDAFAQVGCLAVGKTVRLVAHLVVNTLIHNAHGRAARPHKGQQIFDMVGGLDINGVGPLAQGAVGVKIVLSQHGFQLLGKVMPGREEFQIVAFFRVGHRAAAQKRCGDKRLHTVLASEIFRTDAQGRLLAGVAKHCQHPGNLGWVLYAELIHRACGAFLADNSALHTAAAVELLGKMGNTLVFGL